MEPRFRRAQRPLVLVGAIVAAAVASVASATTFSAHATHRGLVVDRGNGATGRLMTNGWLQRPGEPALLYREGGVTVAAVWENSPDAAVVRSGSSDKASVIGRVVPAWKDGQLSLTIEPANGDPVRTTVFTRESGDSAGALDRETMTRIKLEGTYRATLHAGDGKDAGWMSVDVDPEGGTRFAGDLPPSIPLPLAAAAAAAVESEVDYIYGMVVDVSPLRR